MTWQWLAGSAALLFGAWVCEARDVFGSDPLLNNYVLQIMMMAGINILLCASLNLVNGYLGEFSVGHAGFMSLGAYGSAVLSRLVLPESAMPWAFPAVIVAGGLLAAVFGAVVGSISFRTRGDYLAIITLAFLMMVKSALENMDVVGGPRGLSGIGRETTLVWTVFWVVLCLWCLRNLVGSKVGRAIQAVRDDEIAASLMGVNTAQAKLTAFVVSAFFAGVAGGLFAHLVQFITPGAFGIVQSTEMLVMVYLGGVASLGGSVLGAVLFTGLLELLRPTGMWRLMVMPLLLILLMLFRPKGIMGFREFPFLVAPSDRARKGQA
ncbi:MAG: branched-chain amino acid ABC transporter permease [Candidatus Methylacidiphilales bacterium]